MQGRTGYNLFERGFQNRGEYIKQHNNSLSTSGSSSPRQSLDECRNSSIFSSSSNPMNKQKSQLCKKFVENGFCPYQRKCKFAHGSHQLRRNQQVNSKYKTKQCGVYISNGYCPYGQRCNFIHQKIKHQVKNFNIDEQFIIIASQNKKTSRLFDIIQEQ